MKGFSHMKFIKRIKHKSSWLFLFSIVVLFIFIRIGFSALLENGEEVKENSELTYYLNVKYDGIDKNGVASNDTTLSLVNSDIIYVEDKIPEGLEFVGFVTTYDGSIGAVQRSDGRLCSGRVVDDTNEAFGSTGLWNGDNTEFTYHGLHYNVNNRTVTFQVENLQAGCELTVGIITRTPTIDDPNTLELETRRDFYNFAIAREKNLTVNSNIVHVYMGSQLGTRYDVTYEFTGDLPRSVPSVPSTTSYIAGTKVLVAPDVKIEGYNFSGWTSSDVTISNGAFYMPEKNIVLKGSFTKKDTYKVSYAINGSVPEGYVLPNDKEYYPGTNVKVDFMTDGHIFNEHRFLGWDSTDVVITEDREFTMPEKNVKIIGEFEEVKYRVIYQFYPSSLPPNADSYLPPVKEYSAGDKVTLEDVLGEPEGYKFLGWYKEEEFIMPEEDLTIYGEWKEYAGTFEPLIDIEILDPKSYYEPGDLIRYKITVTNTHMYSLYDTMVKLYKDNAYFDEENGYYYLETDRLVTIDYMYPNSTFELYATYFVTKEDAGIINTKAEIVAATSSYTGIYEMVDKEISDSVDFTILSKLKICKEVSSNYNDNVFQFKVTGNTNNYETWIVLEKDKCETIYVEPSTYKIFEVVPQEYKIKEIRGAISSNNANLVIEDGKDYEITYVNEFIKKGFFHSFGRIVNKIEGGPPDA